VLEVVPSQEYRTFVSSLGAGEGGYSFGDISPEGLLAVGMEDGVRLWELRTGRELATLPGHRSPSKINPFFQETDQGRELIVGGSAGWLRWPLTPDGREAQSAERGAPQANGAALSAPRFALVRAGTRDRFETRKLRLGPPPFLRRAGMASRSADGRFIATSYDGAGPVHVLDQASHTIKAMRGEHPGATSVALSPDGRWLATSGWRTSSVRVWDAHTGEMVREWASQPQVAVFFTPDSRTLILAGGADYQFYAVDTWKEVRRLSRYIDYAGHVAFAPDGRLMALETAPGEISLLEIATARTIARLQDPHGDRASWLGFTPGSTQVVVVANHAKAIHVWDLRA
jgi:WD40 repeat protein